MDLRIRRAWPHEAEALTRIALAAKRHWGYPEEWMDLWTPQLTIRRADLEENENWVAELEGRLIGFYTLLEKDGIAWLENLWVTPDSIRHGVGRRLFLHAIKQSHQRGWDRLQLEADPHAVGFYETMGMHKIGERYSEVAGQSRVLPIMEIQLKF